MELKSFFVQDAEGNIVANATVTVYEQDGVTLASIYDEAGAPKPNPFSAGANGWASFRAATGSYEAYAIIDDLGNTVPIYLTFMSAEEFATAVTAAGNKLFAASLGEAGDTLTLDTNDPAGLIRLTLTQPLCTLVVPPPEDLAAEVMPAVTLVLHQGTGANQVDWPDNVRWLGNRPPVLTYEAGSLDSVTLLLQTDASETYWLGFYNGGWHAA